jgi:uncharacterized protein (TIGR02452 family)
MNRAIRATLGQSTLAILQQGHYALPDGQTITLADDTRHCVNATQVFQPEELRALVTQVLSRSATTPPATLEIENETTLAGIARLVREQGEPVAALNFASARNPGGGFLSGAQAQEESLARSSGLHASLAQARDFYEPHRSDSSLLYSDRLILSPRCPVFRDDAGALLEHVHHVTFISGAAPNAGALQSRQPGDLHLIPDTFRRRIEYVLAVAVLKECRHIVLGAWGCGVFRNDPELVARTFMHLLRSTAWASRFSRVRFSILDRSPHEEIIGSFRLAAGDAMSRSS